MTIPEGNAALAALGNRAATDELIADLAQTVLDRAAHDHPARGEDLYCLNLTSWMGERMEFVLVRLRDAEAERDALRAEVERLRAELADLQGQSALTEHHFDQYVDDAIREQNTLRERDAAAERDAARWRRVEPILTRADRREVPYLDIDGRSLTEIAQEADAEIPAGWDDGTCGDCATGRCHGTTPDDRDCDRHNASVEVDRV